jgi:UDP-N-acetylmuramoyl-L-alanyl-D-glutamate--2,6-diaminopimelate ligase
MGGIAERLADHVVITSDNPRSEVPARINAAILSGLGNAGAATVIEDRAEAIGWAIAKASPDDVILIAGMGHESSQIVGGERFPFSDYQVALVKLATLDSGADE